MKPLLIAARRHGLLLGILSTAALVRLWGIGFGLPHPLCRPDEDAITSVAARFFRGDFNPHFFNYPALFMLVVAAGLAARFQVGRAAGWFESKEDFLRIAGPSGLNMTARLISAAAGIGTVWVAHRAAARLFGRRTGLVSAFFLALAFLHVRDSHFGVTDVAATFLVVTSFFVAVRLAETGSMADLVTAGITAGLATSTKYNAALIALPAVWALVSGRSPRLGPVSTRSWKLVLFGAVMIAAFLAASPYSVLDYREFVRAVTYESGHLAAGHGAMVGRGWLVHVTSSLRYGLGLPLLAAALAGLVLLAWQQPRKAVLVAIFPVAYYLVIGSGFTVFARYILPVVPFLCLTAGYGVSVAAGWAAGMCRRPGWAPALTWALALAVIAPSAWSVVQFDRLLATVDSRLLAARWLEGRFPNGAVVAQVGPLGGRVFFPADDTGRAERYVTVDAGGDDPRPDAVVVQASPIDGPTPLPDDIGQWLAAYQVVHVIHAFDPQARGNTYDRQDEFYLPLDGFHAIERPGPNLTIYVRR